jgi:hypothetical protein
MPDKDAVEIRKLLMNRGLDPNLGRCQAEFSRPKLLKYGIFKKRQLTSGRFHAFPEGN